MARVEVSLSLAEIDRTLGCCPVPGSYRRLRCRCPSGRGPIARCDGSDKHRGRGIYLRVSHIATTKCQFGDVARDPRRARKERLMNLNPLTPCWTCLATLRRLFKSEYWISLSIWPKFRRNKFATMMSCNVAYLHYLRYGRCPS